MPTDKLTRFDTKPHAFKKIIMFFIVIVLGSSCMVINDFSHDIEDSKQMMNKMTIYSTIK